MVAREGVPPFYIAILSDLETAVDEAKADKKKMSKTGAQALIRVYQNLRKSTEPYRAQIEEFRKNPNAAAEEARGALATSSNKAGRGGGAGAGKAAADDSSSDDEVIIGRMGVQVKSRGKAPQRRGGDSSSSDSSSSDSSDSSDDDKAGPAAPQRPAATGAGAGGAVSKLLADDGDESDSQFGSSTESESDSEDDEAYKGLTGRARWVKREAVGKSKDEKAQEKDARRAEMEAKVKAKRERQAKEEAKRAGDGAAAASSASSSAVTTVVDLAALEAKSIDIGAAVQAKKWSRALLEEEVQRVLALRGRKGADVKLLVSYLGALADKALEFGPHVGIPAMLHAVSARFSLSASRMDAFLDRPSWKRSLRDLSAVLSILEANPNLRLAPVAAEDIAEVMAKKADKKGLLATKGQEGQEGQEEGGSASNAAASNNNNNAGGASNAAPSTPGKAGSKAAAISAAISSPVAAQAPQPPAADDPNIVRIVGDLSVLIDGLQGEYIKSLQHMDPHKQDYVVRISDETGLTAVADRAFDWYTRSATEARARRDAHGVTLFEAGATRLAMLRIEHMYYKHDSIAHALRVAAANADKRAEVASLASAAAMQAMEEARRSAIEANRAAAASGKDGQQGEQGGAPGSAPATPSAKAGASGQGPSGGAKATPGEEKDREAAEAAAKAISAAANANIVGDAAARLANAAAVARGKSGFAAASGVVAKALVVELSRREGGLLSGAAVEASRNAAEMETLADLQAATALADAEARGVDLGDLRVAAGESAVRVIDTAATIATLAHFIYRHGDSRAKNRAVLCHVYHHALHDRFAAARDLMIMSRTQDSIATMALEGKTQAENVRVQILYNRALTMLGIAAFRTGQYAEAHECLAEICGSGHTKELLAQGITQFRHGQPEKDPEAEREERRRLVPYHMHVNVELADACHLTSAMLLEVPNIAAAEFDPRRREISKAFRRHLDHVDGKSFVGPPETTRDTIILAALALAEGEWRKAADLVTGLKVWSLWGARNGDKIKDALVNAIKEAGLTTYLHAYSQFYDSLSRDSLCDMFQLQPAAVQGLCSKLMYNGELAAKWDQPTGTLVVQRAPPSRLQAMALDFANHVATLADNNQRMVEARLSGSDKFFGEERRGPSGGDGAYRRGRRNDLARGGGGGRGIIPGGLGGGGGGGGGGGRGGRGGGRGGGGGGFRGGRGGYGSWQYGSGRREYKQRGY